VRRLALAAALPEAIGTAFHDLQEWLNAGAVEAGAPIYGREELEQALLLTAKLAQDIGVGEAYLAAVEAFYGSGDVARNDEILEHARGLAA
jgi:hypothetical protein